jgi:hypothetical protein
MFDLGKASVETKNTPIRVLPDNLQKPEKPVG